MSWQHKLRPDLAEHIMVQEHIREHIREYLKRAVKYRRLDELVIDEERELIRHVLTHVSFLISCNNYLEYNISFFSLQKAILKQLQTKTCGVI